MIKDYVKLRSRERKGVVSLYLDIYYHGRRKQEGLRLYLIPENSRENKRKNKETMALAESICAERLTQVRNNIYKIDDDKVKFFPFYESLMAEKDAANAMAWHSAFLYLREYESNDILISDIDEDWVIGFRDFLNKAKTAKNTVHPDTLSVNTKCAYFRKLKAAMNEAVKRRIISFNPCLSVQAPSTEQSTRSYLTIEELQAMTDVKNINPDVRRPFLFSCLTGLRYSDIVKMVWSEVSCVNGMTRITFHQQKTNNLQYLDITKQAAELLGEHGNPNDKVFPVIPLPTSMNYAIGVWAFRAGIDKHLTFHSARHTFATLMLTLGTDIYTVSKLLGHTDVKTTQIYAKIIDEKRQEAVNKIPDINI